TVVKVRLRELADARERKSPDKEDRKKPPVDSPLDADRPVTTAFRELLKNPGCEETPILGQIPGWIEVTGQWRPRGHDGGGGTPPFEGKRFFGLGNQARGELVQDVDLSAYSDTIDAGKQKIEFNGYVRSFKQDKPDLSRIVIQYRSVRDGIVL